MLRDVVGTFLDTLTEREFDGPLHALLAARGFTDIHFIHGQFEFGKDVVANRADHETDYLLRQYLIQSKAGDIGQHEWRAVRPHLEECAYNTLGHPSFDASLPRVAVLVTTGRLKGGAPADASEYRDSVDFRRPHQVARHTVRQMALLTYPVICNQAAEAVALGLAITQGEGDVAEVAEFELALVDLDMASKSCPRDAEGSPTGDLAGRPKYGREKFKELSRCQR